MEKKIIPLLILILATAAAAQVPTYKLDCILPAPGCFSVDISPDGTKLCARMQYGDYDEGYRVFDANVIDICTDTTILNDCGGHAAPWQGRVSADSAYLWTTVYYGGYVKKIDLSDCSIDKVIDLGSWTYGLAFDSQRRYLYVGENCVGGSSAVGSLKVVDTNIEEVVGSVGLNGQPGECILVDSGDEFVYVFSRNAGSETLYKIRTAPVYTVADTLPIHGTGMHLGFSLSPDGKKCYIPNPSSGEVHVIDTASMLETDVWNVGNVRGFFVSPDGNHAIITPASGDKVDIRVFDLNTEMVSQTIPLPDTGLGSPFYHLAWPVYWDWGDTGLNAVYIPIPGVPDGGVAVLSISEPAEPNIAVSPLSHDFGDVELGTSSTVVVTISNVGNGGLNVSGIGLETDFAITSAPAASIVVEPDTTVDVEITYTPTVLGYNSAVLKITSDDPDEPVVEVRLSAAGVEIPVPPSEQIANILVFFDTSMGVGSLVGDGPANSAEKRLNALRNMIEAAGDLIENELSEEACQQLLDVYSRMDGQPKPPDFVKGEAVPELASMLQDLMTSLGCE